MEINGKTYPMWSQFVEKQQEFIGGILEDSGDNMDRAMGLVDENLKTVITGIELKPNGDNSAWFEVHGEKFSCGFDVQYGGIVAGDKGWLTFSGYGGHTWRIKNCENSK